MTKDDERQIMHDAIRDSWDFNLREEIILGPTEIRDAIKAAFLEWLEANRASVLAAIEASGMPARDAAPGFGIEQDALRALDTIRGCPDGLTRTEINRKAFSGHRSSDQLRAIIAKLRDDGLIALERRMIGGMQRTVWKETGKEFAYIA